MAEIKKELTPEQIEKRRAKNRARSEKKKLARQEEQKNNAPAQNKPTKQTKQTNQRPQRQSEEEYLEGLISSKSERIQRDPRNSIVSTAEAYESRTLAFAVREVNTIADYVRNNFGTERVSTDVGIELIDFFSENIKKNIDDYISLACSNGIGSRRTLSEYRDEQRKQKNREIAEENFRNKTIQNETPDETKEREQHEKAVEKAQSEIDKANEAMQKAKEALEKAEQCKAESLEILSDGYSKRHEAQKERKQAEAQKAKEAKLAEKESAEASKKEETPAA